MPGRSGYNEGKIRHCTLPSCTAPTDYVGGLNSPVAMLVDDAGAYIINAVNVIQRCSGTSCTGGAQDWSAGTAPQFLQSDANFVYWADGAIVKRIAK